MSMLISRLFNAASNSRISFDGIQGTITSTINMFFYIYAAQLANL